MALPDGAAEVFATRTRISVLDSNGYIAVGANVYVTDELAKATFTPVMETGDTIAVKGADGTLKVLYKHGDMPKHYTMQLEFATVTSELEAMLMGGTLLTTTATALTAPTAPTGTASTTGGTLGVGKYSYKVTACNQWGETTASPASTTVTVATGTTNKVTLTWTAVTGAKYYRVYGRTKTAWQFIAQVTGHTYVDTGSAVPSGAVPASNSTAGPGNYGVQSPKLGIVGNPNGVAVEFWGKAVVDGTQVTDLPWYWWVIPAVRNLQPGAMTFVDAVLEHTYTGEAFENPNFGTGPMGDWPGAATRVWQHARVASTTLPTVGLSAIPATA